MIVSQVSGGLGNQLFAYASGKALAERHRAQLYLDVDWYENMDGATPRVFELDKFRVRIDTISKNQYVIGHESKMRYLNPIRKVKVVNRYVCKGVDFFEDYVNIPNNSLLCGFWNDASYFRRVEPQIRKQVRLNKESNKLKGLIQLARKDKAIAVHVRRGDYASDPKARDYLGMCRKEYYRQALNMVRNRVKSGKIYLFSDEPRFATKWLGLQSNCTNVGDFGLKDYEELVLMGKCSHHIVANSTFSWWGAWLASSSSQIVIAPDPWFLVNKNYNPAVNSWHIVNNALK